MQVHRKEFNLLKNTKTLIESRFHNFGINKKQEIIRLVYEICKKGKNQPQKILKDLSSQDFKSIKKQLLRKRFPYSYNHNEIIQPYLPKIDLNPESFADINNAKFYPKKIFVEKSARDSYLKNRFKDTFHNALFIEIDSLKKYLEKNKGFRISDYNKRREIAFITNEDYDLFKKCPCTKGAIRCGYHIFNLSFGCIFECTYCYLQEYTNTPGLIFPANIDRFFDKFYLYKKSDMRIGTGEFSDSLMLDHITGYSLEIADFFKRHNDILFEFKTKSINISNLLKAKHAGNIVVSWSLNPQKIIDKNEFLTANLKDRLNSSKKCSEAGYKVGFHFDPVIYFKGWKDEYGKVIEMLFGNIKPENIAWISLGTFRFKPELKPIIENRFPSNEILNEELLLGYDNKLRYPYGLRYGMYKFLLDIFRKHSKKLPIYLCMEELKMWKDLNLLHRVGGV